MVLGKLSNSRNTWSNRQMWPWSTEWSRTKAHRILLREHTGHSKHPLPTTQEKTLHMDITRWPIEITLIIFFAAREGLYSKQKEDGELTVIQIMNSLLTNSDLKKVGRTTRLFMYDLYQIPYDYTVEVRNRFKGSDMIECLVKNGWRFVTWYRRQGSRPSPRKRNARKQNGCLRRPYK